MYIFNLRRERVQLTRLDPGRMEESGKATLGAGPPPAVFRDAASGLLHAVYGEIVIRFVPAASEKRRQGILRKEGFEILRVNPFVPDQVVVEDPRRRCLGEQLLDVSNRWMDLDEVVFATPNFVSQFLRHEPPSIRPEEWHLRNTGAWEAKAGEDVNAVSAWRTTTGDPRVVVAVLDDGVDVEHPNLAGSIWKNPVRNARDEIGRDFFVPAEDPGHFDPRPKRFQFPFDQKTRNDIHGTCCAGIIAARGRGGGSVGIAPGCRILPVKIFHADDLASGEGVANAIRYAALHADALSCSWSCGTNPDIEQALEDAQLGRGGRGSAVFGAAGNGHGGLVSFPARDPNAIAVGASTDQGARAPYSNVGPQIAFVAPSSGGKRDIFTTDVSRESRGFDVALDERNGKDRLHTNHFGGTSAATALAAGVGALALSVNPALSRLELRSLLERTAVRIGGGYDNQGHSPEFGHGRIDAGRAVAEALAARAQASRR